MPVLRRYTTKWRHKKTRQETELKLWVTAQENGSKAIGFLEAVSASGLGLVWLILYQCQHDNGYIDGQSQI